MALRIQFYGVQGSGSIFPTHEERSAMRELSELHLLESVMEDLVGRAGADGRIGCSVEDILGGPVDMGRLRAYRRRFNLPGPRSYGGWTTCVHVETADGYDIVLDCGSGFRNCASALQLKWGNREERHLYIFGTHSHSDHTEGFDQAPVCFDPRNVIHIHGNASFLRALDSYLGIFTREISDDRRGLHTPIHFGIMPAQFEGIELGPEGASDGTFGKVHSLAEPVEIGETRITAIEVHHPAPCLAYKLEHGEASFLFCTDHELRRGEPDAAYRASHEAEARLRAHAEGIDLLYRDGQFLQAEYDGLVGIGGSAPVPRVDWGHSCIEDVEEMAVACHVKKTLIGHHDPNRGWMERNRIDEALSRNNRHRPYEVELARAEGVIDL